MLQLWSSCHEVEDLRQECKKSSSREPKKTRTEGRQQCKHWLFEIRVVASETIFDVSSCRGTLPEATKASNSTFALTGRRSEAAKTEDERLVALLLSSFHPVCSFSLHSNLCSNFFLLVDNEVLICSNKNGTQMHTSWQIHSFTVSFSFTSQSDFNCWVIATNSKMKFRLNKERNAWNWPCPAVKMLRKTWHRTISFWLFSFHFRFLVMFALSRISLLLFYLEFVVFAFPTESCDFDDQMIFAVHLSSSLLESFQSFISCFVLFKWQLHASSFSCCSSSLFSCLSGVLLSQASSSI